MKKVKDSRFPISLFFEFFALFIAVSGVHMALIFFIKTESGSALVSILLIMVYWIVVALVLTLLTRRQIQKRYEEPLHVLAQAAAQVAGGDFSVYVAPLHTEDKQDYLDIMINDFNKMIEDLGSVETLRVDFFSNVSHEIKTPLAVIQNTAELMKREDLDKERESEYIDTIIESSKKLNALITNILKLNKLEKQTIKPEIMEFDLSEQLVQCTLQFESIWEKKNIETDVDIQDERLPINGDPDMLSLVWNNLLSNAFKFTPEGGKVYLRERSDERNVFVEVEDTGCGMSDKTIAHIFDKFYQGDTSHAVEGNGLGLALAMRVLKIMGAEIKVDSAPDRGSKFTVTLPRS